MTIDQLIDGYLQLYRRLSNSSSILYDVLKIYRKNGINRASAVVAANKLYFRQDAMRKEKTLRKSQKEISLEHGTE
jgi:hypothetical protein